MAQVGIGTVTVDHSSILESASTTQGVLFPQLSTVERGTISMPANGLIIYNTDSNTLNINSGTSAVPVWDVINSETANCSKVGQSLKYNSSDTSSNINTTIAIDAPIFGTEEWNDNTSLFIVSGNTVQVTETGRYKIVVNLSILSTSTTSRKAPEIYLTVNGTQVGTFGSTGYIRRNSGHEETSLHINEVIDITANDVVAVQIIRSGSNNTATLRSTGSSNFYIEKRS